jgi:hypothetical protein
VKAVEAAHMLLTACQQDPLAREDEGQRVFTKELLRNAIGNLTPMLCSRCACQKICEW